MEVQLVSSELSRQWLEPSQTRRRGMQERPSPHRNWPSPHSKQNKTAIAKRWKTKEKRKPIKTGKQSPTTNRTKRISSLNLIIQQNHPAIVTDTHRHTHNDCLLYHSTLIGWAIAFVRAIGAVTRSVTLPPLRQASVLVFAAEFFIAASTAGELVVPLAAILSSVAHPTFGNTRIVAAATVFVRQTFTFGSYSFQSAFPFVLFVLCVGEKISDRAESMGKRKSK